MPSAKLSAASNKQNVNHCHCDNVGIHWLGDLDRLKPVTQFKSSARPFCSLPNEFLRNSAFTALIWVFLFEVNDFLFGFLELNENVNLVFLPAAIRILAVLVAGYAGATGLFVGALVTNAHIIDTNLLHAVAMSALSAIGPVIAVWLSLMCLGVSKDLRNVKWWHLFVLAAVGALCNVIPTQIHLWSNADVHLDLRNVGAMLIGDLVGTGAVLWVASFVAKLVAKIHSQS